MTAAATTQRIQQKCETLLERLTTASDGRALELVQLTGFGVPTDADVYVCQRTLIALQVRVKQLDHPTGTLHEYPLEPESVKPADKGGVYELQCSASKHHVQVKVQPPLGLAALLPSCHIDSNDATTDSLGDLLAKDLWSFMGAFYILFAFVSDPQRKSVPLAASYSDATEHIDWILDDIRMLDQLNVTCPMFSKTYDQPPKFQLVEPDRPKTRGMLLKAFLEMKMLIIRSARQIQECGERLLTDRQLEDFDAFMIHVYKDCCKGGVDKQLKPRAESTESLRLTVCGSDGSSHNGSTDGCAEPEDEEQWIEVEVQSAQKAEVEEKEVETTGPASLERPQAERLKRKLDEVLKHLGSGSEILTEANGISDQQFALEKSKLAEVAAQVRNHIESLEKSFMPNSKVPRTE